MPAKAVVGLQWGDEGKGKIVDRLAEDVDVVVRCQGGANAGHTVVVGNDVYALHLLPSGILRSGIDCVIGNGVVVDPLRLAKELADLDGRIPCPRNRLFISDRAHIVLPWHKELDGLREAKLGKGSIGTTRQGIGPAYVDKALRTGLRWHDARDPARLRECLTASICKAEEVVRQFGAPQLDWGKMERDVLTAVDSLREYIADTVTLLHDWIGKGRRILLEGAQGLMLDLDFGTYPFVTSSSTSSGGCLTGSGLPPSALTEVHGLLKAFTTRVGSGPFPTEETDDVAVLLRGTGKNQWDEFGTTTGRPRRCGWLDLVVARHSTRVNGVTHIHMTKMDVLSQFDEIKICVAYELNGKEITYFPADPRDLEACRPVYKTFPGWREELKHCSSLDGLPKKAADYARFIAEYLGTPLATVSYGPGRDQTVVCI